MRKRFRDTGLDWYERGYFGAPDLPQDARLPVNTMDDPWLVWTIALAEAKVGKFETQPLLVDILTSTSDAVLASACSDLVGDAGTTECFAAIWERLLVSDDFELSLHLCNALYLDGRLSNVPVILAEYMKYSENSDADIIPVWISDLLEEVNDVISEPHRFEDVDDYKALVMNRYNQLVEQLGGESALVFRGRKFGVATFAKHMLGWVQEPFARNNLRQKFEASTGIDCTSFYQNGNLQSLSAAAIVEDFLEGREIQRFEENIRYFFGHRIPG